MSKVLVKNIGMLQTPVGSHLHIGSEQGENKKIKNAVIFIEEGIINFIGSHQEWIESERWKDADEVIDAENKLVTPGLIDGHTHLVFGGYRENEIPLKLAGAGYLDILKAGGGILDTVEKTRAATEDELFCKSIDFLDEMMSMGVTSCEIKSGYGLNLEDELKTLRVIGRLGKDHQMDVACTFMGAHAIPPEYRGRGDEYMDVLVDEILPAVKKTGLATYADVFCEDGAFSLEQSRRYMERAAELGFGLKIHADELVDMGGSSLAGEMKAISAEHLIAIGDDGIKALAEGGTIGMCLPSTSFYLGKTYAPARKMIDSGIGVAISTDFNPGSCPSLNLQLSMNLAYLKYGMWPEEILTAVTINGACSMGKGSQLGTLEVGKQADMVIWQAENMEMICYRFGSNLVDRVIKKGKIRGERNG